MTREMMLPLWQLTSEVDMVRGWASTHAALHHQGRGGALLRLE